LIGGHGASPVECFAWEAGVAQVWGLAKGKSLRERQGNVKDQGFFYGFEGLFIKRY
jgi:hypothetical protein